MLIWASFVNHGYDYSVIRFAHQLLKPLFSSSRIVSSISSLKDARVLNFQMLWLKCTNSILYQFKIAGLTEIANLCLTDPICLKLLSAVKYLATWEKQSER